MDNDELLKLAGEQALLQKERSEKAAALQREKAGLLTFVNELNLGLASGWLEREHARLDRLQELGDRLREIDLRVEQLKKITGL